MLAACATTNVNLPSITNAPTAERFPGKIVWHDLLTNDVAASKRFYGELFGWEFESVGTASGLRSDSAYTLIRHNGRMIGGMIDTIALNGRDDISRWVVVMSVTDVDASADAFADSGGKILTPPSELQSRGRLAVVQDDAGALLALLETRDGDPADAEPELNGFLWNELWTDDVDRATSFYRTAINLDHEDHDTDGRDGTPANYRVLKSHGQPRAGILQRPLPDLPPVWVSYLRVADPAALTARAADYGGRVIVEAQPRSLGGTVAFVAGPSGAGIALQTWPLNQASSGDE